MEKHRKVKDSGSKLIFENPELCSQLLRGYTDIPQLQNVKAEDIEDVSERYVHMFTEERAADTVKRVRLSENESMFLLSLIEHKSYVDYNVIMQLLRYMVFIWEDYEKEMEQKHKGISKTKDFKYPFILPIVYYEGAKKWTAANSLKERILMSESFMSYIPDFTYKLIQLNDYTRQQLAEKQDELSLLLMINQIQSIEDFSNLDLPEDYLRNLSENSSDYLKELVAKIVTGLLRHLKIPEQEIMDFTGQVKEQRMGELFENFKDFDFPAAKKKAMEEGRAEGLSQGRVEGLSQGRAEGLSQGRAEGLSQGISQGISQGEQQALKRVNRLIQLLMEQSRLDDISRMAADEAYQKKLFAEFEL